MEEKQGLRILQVVQGFPPEFIGGTELYCRALTHALQDRGHHCFVLAGCNQQAKEPALVTTEEGGICVTRYTSPLSPIWREQRIDPYNPEAELLIRQHLQTVCPDVIHVHHWLRLTNNLVSLAAELGIPAVVTLHDMWTSCARLHRQHRLGHFCQEPPSPSLCYSCVERYPWQEDTEVQQAIEFRQKQITAELHLARCFLVPSETHQQFLSRLIDISPDRLQVVPHGSIVHLSPHTDDQQPRFPHRPLRLAYWGYLAPHKGVHLLLEAVRQLKEPSTVEIHLAGLAPDAQYLQHLEKLAEGLSVTFAGEYQPADLARLEADIAVFPSLAYESYGFVLDEALQLRLPVIVSDRGALATRAGEAGLAFAAGDVEALARRIQEILDSPARLKDMRQKLPSVSSPSMVEHAQTLETIYKEAVGIPPQPPASVARNEPRRVVYLHTLLAARDQEVLRQSTVLAARDQEIRQQQEALESRDAFIAKQGTVIAEQGEALEFRDAVIAEQGEELHHREEVIVGLDQRLREEVLATQALQEWVDKTSRSVGWRFLQRFYYIREHLIAPPGTRRGRLYDLLKRTGGAYTEGGVAGVIKQTSERLDSATTLNPYQLWLAQHALTPERIRQLRAEVQTLAYQPKISLVMPVYNTEETWLRKAIESVCNQIYPYWELCLCDDGSTADHVSQIIAEHSQQDKRIHVLTSPQNRGISAASNGALSLATGEFVGLLDHDDELSVDALFEVVGFINAHPEVGLVYTDEDKIDPQGQRFQPFFKPDWSPDMLLSFMYTCHFSVYRRELLLEVGGFDPAYDGSQDYDLALRVTEKTRVIGHVPKVLYHWRVVSGSVAENANNKLYAYEAGKRALAVALQRRKISGVVEDTFGKQEGLGFYRVRRLHENTPRVSIIIPTRDKVDLLARCLTSIEKYTTYQNYEIVIVDNDSVEPSSLQYLRETPHQVIPYRGAFHFSKLMNFAAQRAAGEVFLFLNNDVEILNYGWLAAMLEHARRPEVGAVGAKLLYPNNTIQHAGVVIGLCEFAGHSHRHVSGFDHGYWGSADIIRNYGAVTAACMMVRREVFFEAGGFDEAFLYAYQDVDLCLRLGEKGFLIVYTPYAQLVHYESATRGGKMAFGENDISLARSRWRRYLVEGDPYYNPNLSRLKEDFSLALAGE